MIGRSVGIVRWEGSWPWKHILAGRDSPPTRYQLQCRDDFDPATTRYLILFVDPDTTMPTANGRHFHRFYSIKLHGKNSSPTTENTYPFQECFSQMYRSSPWRWCRRYHHVSVPCLDTTQYHPTTLLSVDLQAACQFSTTYVTCPCDSWIWS